MKRQPNRDCFPIDEGTKRMNKRKWMCCISILLGCIGGYLFVGGENEEKQYLTELMNGQFDCLTNGDKDGIGEVYHFMDSNDNVEWIQTDLNDDDVEDLILQEKNSPWQNKKIIVGIFTCEENGAKCVLWDVNDYGEFYYCGNTGEIMYYYRWNSGIYTIESNRHYDFDAAWNKTSDYTLTAYSVCGSESEMHADDWKEKHPDMLEDGYYYRQYMEKIDIEKILTFEEFQSIYEEEMGFAYDNSEFQTGER